VIPTLEDLQSDPLIHRFEDMFALPGLTNFLGAAQVDHDLCAIRSVTFPPLSNGDTITGQLFLDGRLFRSLGEPVTVRWRPDRVIRRAEHGELALETTTACPPDATAVLVELRITNRGERERRLRVGWTLASTVTCTDTPWLHAGPPSERNTHSFDRGRGAVLGGSPDGACYVQGFDRPLRHASERYVECEARIGPGNTWRVGLVHALAATEAEALALYDRQITAVADGIAGAEQRWRSELQDAFDPGAGSFSGALPVLETESQALREVYWSGLLGVIWFKRDGRASVLGRVYDTLMPRYWQTVTYIWDYSLSSIVHALLDPAPMRVQLEHWIAADIRTHYGTEWLTGGPVGVWYSVNDWAMTRLVRDYVRFSGDIGWLARAPGAGAQTIAAHLRGWATAWRELRRGHGLADYGGIDNLLECVSTYVHEVASLNAANVWCLRVAAGLAERDGDAGGAAELREQAAGLLAEVQALYVEGGGYWNVRHPEGRLHPVRHCYDFCTVARTIGSDLTAAQREEMVGFFVRELQTPGWMRALSPRDPDAAYSVRPDHQWNGAYTAWPADAARALIELGRADLAAAWLPGLAEATHQGPLAQAHFVEGITGAEHRGAPKAPSQFPYLIDWACSSSGAFVELVVEGFFGLQVPVGGPPQATPRLADIDPTARLRGLQVAGRRYDVSAAGVVPASD
jgi:hypothetical protein